MKVIIAVLLAILVIDLCSLWFQSATTSLAVVPEVKTIGAETPVEVEATNPHGIRRVTAWRKSAPRFPGISTTELRPLVALEE